MLIHSASSQNCKTGTYSGTSGTSGFSGDGGDASVAKMDFGSYGGISVDTSMKLFIADLNNNRVRVVDPSTKVISTIVGKFFSPLLF